MGAPRSGPAIAVGPRLAGKSSLRSVRLLAATLPLGAALPVLQLGICAYNEDVNNPPPWPGVVAAARKSFESSDPIIPLQGAAAFEVEWHMAYAESSADSINEGINRILGSRMDGVSHAPAQAIVGCGGSSTSAKVAPLGAIFGVPLVSWWAGSPTLSNKLEFPYFLRTRGTSTGNGAGVVRLCKHFGWSRIGFIYEEQDFHIGVYEGAVAQAQQMSVDLEPFRLFHFPGAVDEAVWTETFAAAANTGLMVFGMSVMGPVSKNRVALQAALSNGLNRRLFVAALELQDFYPAHPEELRSEFNGMLGIDYSQSGVNDISAKFEQAWRAMDFQQMRDLGIPDGYVNNMNSTIPGVFSNSPFMQFQAYLFDAIHAILIAYQSMLDAGLPANATSYGQDFLDALYATSFRGASGDVSFSPIVNGKGGNRDVSTFTMFNTQSGAVVTVGSLSDSVSLDAGIVFPDGGSDPRAYDHKLECASGEIRAYDSQLSAMVCEPCAAGSEPNTEQDACGSCAVGYMSPSAGSKCSACLQGSFQGSSGMLRCSDCGPGTFTATVGQGECQLCPPGSVAPSSASAGCEPCREGEEQPDEGQAACQRCSQGAYNPSPGSATCLVCHQSRTTPGFGAVSSVECLCGEGTFSLTPADGCKACLEGMICALGSDLTNWEATLGGSAAGGALPLQLRTYPKLKAGFYSSAADPLNVYQCSNEVACPGGDPGTCSAGRSDLDGGFLCMQCGAGYYLSSEGGCEKCEWHHTLVLVLCAVGATILLLAQARVSAVRLTSQKPHLTTLFIVGGQLVTFLQTAATFQAMGLKWGQPFQSWLGAISFFSFSVDVLKLDCISIASGRDSYVFLVLAPAAFVLLFLLYFLVLRAVKPGFLKLDALINSIGQLSTILYISLALLAFVPYHCFEHPNGKSSIVEYPQVLCYEGGAYGNMLGLGIAGTCLYPALTICVVFYAIRCYPKVIVSNDIGFVWRFRFVFYRWTPTRYWFGGVLVVRNFLLALFPMTISKKSVDVMSMLMFLTLLTTLLATARFMPWRSPETNQLDIVLSFVLVFTLSIGSMTVHGHELSHALSAWLLALTLISVTFAAIIGVWRITLLLVRRPKYAVFLSHHKGAGACVARLLKYTMERQLRQSVFYDCDDLSSFGGIFDAVKDSQRLLVILSGETLCRPWCVGEVVTAHHCNIPMRAITLDSEGHKDRWLESTAEDQQLISSQFEVLRPHGIVPEDVPAAFKALLAQPPVVLNLAGKGQGLWATLKELTADPRSNLPTFHPWSWLSKAIQPLPSSEGSAGGAAAECTVLIMSDFKNPEAAAAAHYLYFVLQQQLQDGVAVDSALASEEFAAIVTGRSLRVALWLVSPATTLASAFQLSRLAILYKCRPTAQVVPVIVGDSFPFPDTEYYDRLEKEKADFCEELVTTLPCSMNVTDVSAALRTVFKGIAMFVNIPYANQQVLSTSTENLAQRVRSLWGMDPATQMEGGFTLVQLTQDLFVGI